MANYDFIVVGAGAGGAVLANRLTENKRVKVLLLEAGTGEIPENVRIPAAWPTLLGAPTDWGYATVPQPGANNRNVYEPRGKMRGGSSNMYIMMHIRGHESDFDNWAYNGAYGWSYKDVLPYFQKLEDQDDDTSPWAGHGGMIAVQNAKNHSPNPTSRTFLEACEELGYPRTNDFNGPNMIGAGWHHVNIKDGKRHGANEAYIEPIMGTRQNLTINHNSYATRLLFNRNKRCTGVEYVQDGEVKQDTARYEVIVCGGAIESPKLLLLSGIGSPEQLKSFGIKTISPLRGVGENFHNHVLTGIIYETNRPVPPPNLNMSESALFCKSDPGWVGPDLQIAFVHVPFDIIVGQNNPNAVSILPGVVRPLSRGWIRLGSADPTAKPLVNTNYLGNRSDFERLVKAVEISREIFHTKAFSEWLTGKELLPGPDYSTPEKLREFVRNRAESYHHQAGSCKMGVDDMSVVDPELRVYGVEGVRVCDASIFPQVPSGNCHAAILMAGEKVSDLIKRDHKL